MKIILIFFFLLAFCTNKQKEQVITKTNNFNVIDTSKGCDFDMM